MVTGDNITYRIERRASRACCARGRAFGTVISWAFFWITRAMIAGILGILKAGRLCAAGCGIPADGLSSWFRTAVTGP